MKLIDIQTKKSYKVTKYWYAYGDHKFEIRTNEMIPVEKIYQFESQPGLLRAFVKVYLCKRMSPPWANSIYYHSMSYEVNNFEVLKYSNEVKV